MLVKMSLLLIQIFKYCFKGNFYDFLLKKRNLKQFGFTLVEMLMALLIVSVILSASLPVISQRQKAMASSYNQNRSFPVGGVILWTDMNKLPDNTWMECNGASLPGGIEYEQARRVFGERLPDLRNNSMEYINNLNTYLSNDIKNYLQNAIKPIPQNLIGIWGTNAAIPEGWSWDRSYDGVFLRGFGGSSAQIGVLQEGTGIGSQIAYAHDVNIVHSDGIMSAMRVWVYETNPTTDRHNMNVYRVRPINKAVKFIKYTNAPVLPNIPDPPTSKIYYRYIAKVRY